MEYGEQLGYLTALVEQLNEQLKEEKKESAEWREKLNARIQKIEDELSMYKTMVKTLKFLAGALVALLTWKWSVVLDLWQHWRG